MDPRFECPQCGAVALDVHRFESMIVVTPDYALFTLACPACGQRLSCVRPIPKDMRDQVRSAAHVVGAKMGSA